MRNNTTYYYLYDLTGNVIALVKGLTGNVAATYTYDAWGNCSVQNVGSETIGTINPFRYKGYFYDQETGFYYLNDRYYTCELGRLLSADTTNVLDVQSDLYDKNLYAYCDNNPITRVDANGKFWSIVSGMLIGALTSMTVEIGMQLLSTSRVDWINVGLATIGGAASGALAATGFGYIGQAVGNAMICGASEMVSQVRNGNRDVGSILLNSGKVAAIGVVSVAIGGEGIKADGTAYRKSLVQLKGVQGNINKAMSNPKGYRHEINRAIKKHQTVTKSSVKNTTIRFAGANLFANFASRFLKFIGL